MHQLANYMLTKAQATAETVNLGPAHPPKEDAISAFEQILPELKKSLVHLRHEYSSEWMRLCALRTHSDSR